MEKEMNVNEINPIEINTQAEESDNVMYFDNDDAFFEFSVNPELIIKNSTRKNGDTFYYYDFDFSPAYKNAIANGIKFIIKDPNSRIMKNKDIGYKLITKPVDNLEEYINVEKPCLKKKIFK